MGGRCVHKGGAVQEHLLRSQACFYTETKGHSPLGNSLNTINDYHSNKDFFFDKELKGYEIYVDETLVNKKAGFGIHIKKRNQYNFYDRVEGEETLQNATYQGILHTLKGFPQDQPIVFIIDRKGVINVMENFPTSHKKQQDSLHLDTLKRIQEELLKRTTKVQFKHCYSHTNEKNHDEETLDSNLTKKNHHECHIWY